MSRHDGPIVEWRSSDPRSTAGRLAASLGVVATDQGPTGWRLDLSIGRIEVVAVAPGSVDRLAIPRFDEAATGSGPPVAAPGLAGIGWATVDGERAGPEVAAALGQPGLRFDPGPVDVRLGARTWIAPFDGLHVVLLEPSTEGRLAAALARMGEGTVAVWVGPVASGGRRARPGPLGPAVLLDAAGVGGPFLLGLVGYHPRMTDQPTVTLRPAAVADAERIASLLTDEGYPAGMSDIVERLERFSTERSQVIVADLDGEVIGFIAVHLLPRFEHGDHVARVLALVVDPGARERGLGRRLMEEAEGIATAAQAAFIEVTAGHHRPDARRLYESLGYDAGMTTYLRKRL